MIVEGEDPEKMRYFMFSSNPPYIMAVAHKGEVNDWAAYIAVVEGKNIRDDAWHVIHNGTKLPYNVAKEIFPYFNKVYEWRD